MPEYKILPDTELKDLEKVLNSHAKEGWRLKQAIEDGQTTLLLILERV